MVISPRCAPFGALLLAGLLLAGLADPAGAQTLRTEAEVTDAVRSHNLALQAVRAGAAAEADRPDQVRWPFPMAELMAMPQMIADGELGIGVAARQTIPQAGRLRADRAARRAAADAAVFAAEDFERDQVLMAREAYAELWGLQEQSARVDTFRTRLALYRESALAQLRTGRGPQQAVLNLQVEADMLAQRLDALDESASALRARLAALTGGTLQFRAGDVLAPPGVDRQRGDDLVAAIEAHPAVSAGEAMREAEEAIARMRGTMARPEFTLGAAINLSPMAREGRFGQQLVTPMVGVMVPLWREGVRAEVRESEERARQRGLEADHARVVLAAEAEDAIARLARVRQRIDRYERDLLPTVQQALESTLSGYRTGAVRFLELLDAQRTAFSIEVDLIEARVQEAALSARLDAIIGA
jgi:outer membrane protein, heavy metal efflux system